MVTSGHLPNKRNGLNLQQARPSVTGRGMSRGFPPPPPPPPGSRAPPPPAPHLTRCNVPLTGRGIPQMLIMGGRSGRRVNTNQQQHAGQLGPMVLTGTGGRTIGAPLNHHHRATIPPPPPPPLQLHGRGGLPPPQPPPPPPPRRMSGPPLFSPGRNGGVAPYLAANPHYHPPYQRGPMQQHHSHHPPPPPPPPKIHHKHPVNFGPPPLGAHPSAARPQFAAPPGDLHAPLLQYADVAFTPHQTPVQPHTNALALQQLQPFDRRQILRNSALPQQQQQQQLPRVYNGTSVRASAPIVASPTPPPHAVHTHENTDQAWIEYQPPDGGKAYYYNIISGRTQWDKPASLKRNENDAATHNPSQQWKEFTDALTGKKYYSDGTTSKWDKPGDSTCDLAPAAAPDESSSRQPPRKKRSVAGGNEFRSKEEAVAAFTGLLLVKEITPTMKWNDVVKLCSSDPPWDAFADVLSVGERKQTLAEYQTKRANHLKNTERQEKARAKDSFRQLLADTLPLVAGFSARSSRFVDVRDAVNQDVRFQLVASEATRESLFVEFCEELKKREDRKKQNRMRESKDAFLAFLKEKKEEGLLSFASTYTSFLSMWRDEEKPDSRLTTSAAMSDKDRQLYFSDFVIELQALDDEKRSRIRGARRRAEKAQRLAFKEALQTLAINGRIVPSDRWRNVQGLVAALPSYGPVYVQDREAPREIFEDFVAIWNEIYRRDRSILSKLVYPRTNKQVVVTAATSYEEFTEALLEAADSPDMISQARCIIARSEPVSSAQIYLQELLLNAKASSNGSVRMMRPGTASRHGSSHDSSSEDEGEIVEDRAVNC